MKVPSAGRQRQGESDSVILEPSHYSALWWRGLKRLTLYDKVAFWVLAISPITSDD